MLKRKRVVFIIIYKNQKSAIFKVKWVSNVTVFSNFFNIKKIKKQNK